MEDDREVFGTKRKIVYSLRPANRRTASYLLLSVPLLSFLPYLSPSLPGFPDRASSLKSYVHNNQSLRRRHRKLPTGIAIAAAAVSLSMLSTAPTGDDPPSPTRLLHLGRAPNSFDLPRHPAVGL